MINDIYIRTPVNKAASVIVNQCHCDDELQLNNLIQERAQLIKNVTEWMSIKRRSKETRVTITEANKQLALLNRQLKPYDEHHRNTTPRSFNEAFMMAAKNMLDSESYTAIYRQAKKLSERI